MVRELEETQKRLQQVEHIINQAKFDEALQVMEYIINEKDLDEEALITYKILKSQILSRKGDFDTGLKLALEALEESQLLKNLLKEVDAYITIIEVLERLGQYDESLSMIENASNVLNTLVNEPSKVITKRKASLHYWEGRLRWRIGQLDKALENYQESLVLSQEIGSTRDIALSLNDIGLVHMSDGIVDQALEYYQQSLVLREKLGSIQTDNYSFHNLGYITSQKGDLDQSLENLRKSLTLYEEINNKYDLAHSFLAIGRTYGYKGELDIAKTYLERGLNLFEEDGNKFLACFSLFFLFFLAINKPSREQAQDYLQRLQKIEAEFENEVVNQVVRIANALFLKTSPRMKDKVKAQEILKHVIEEKIRYHFFGIIAMLNLCELLLDEVRAYGEEEVFEEAKTVIQKLMSWSKKEQSYFSTVNALVLQAKFALIEGKLTEAVSLLDQARDVEKVTNQSLLAEIVISEKNQLEEQLSSWRDLLESNATLQERLEHARILEYVDHAKKLVKINQ